MAGSLYVFCIAYRKKGLKFAEGKTVLFATLASFSILLWFLYNFAIWKDPFYFAFGLFSARSQQVLLEKGGLLPTHKNIILSFLTYLYACIYNNGVIAVVLGGIGFLLALITTKKNTFRWGMLLFATPFIFNVISLYLGQSVIWVPDVAPFHSGFFNIRYGLLMAPSLAVLIGYLSTKLKKLNILLLILILIQGVWFYYDNNTFSARNIITMRDSIGELRISYNDPSSTWIRGNCGSGLTLMSTVNDPAMFYTGLPLKKFISEGNGNYWTQGLKNPQKYARCVVFGTYHADGVREAIQNSKTFDKYYLLAKKYQGLKMYMRKKV